LKPGQTVIEIQPGSGWWTDILAPYLARTEGHYISAEWDLTDPTLTPAAREFARKDRAAFEAKYESNPNVYGGEVPVVSSGPTSVPLAHPGSADLVLVVTKAGFVLAGRLANTTPSAKATV
jgi:predicted methyltransferase